MGLTACEHGHYYNSQIREECPFCAKPSPFVTCEAGHCYNRQHYKACPFCDEDVEEEPIIQRYPYWTDCPDPENTLVFVSEYAINYQLWKEDREFRMTRRCYLGKDRKLVEKTISLSESDAMETVRRVLSESGYYLNNRTQGTSCQEKKSDRVLINTEGVCVDCWPDYSCFWAHDVLKEMEAMFQKTNGLKVSRYGFDRRNRRNLLVRLSRNNYSCTIRLERGGYRMWLKGIGFMDEIPLSQEAAREIAAALSSSGVFYKGSEHFSDETEDTSDMPVRYDEEVECHYPVNMRLVDVMDYLVDCFVWYYNNP